jgi:high affinity Mn2+ porin
MGRFLLGGAALMTVVLSDSARSADFKSPGAAASYDWSGFYLGADVGYSSARSNWSATQPGGAPSLSGSLDLFRTFDVFDGSGSAFGGLHAGYNYMLPSHFGLGVEADARFPGTLGGGQNFFSPAVGAANYNDTIEMAGSVRGRIGYDVSRWLYYVTGGFAWTYDQFTRSQVTDSPTGSAPAGTVETSFLGRIGWTVGAGVEAPIAPGAILRLRSYLESDSFSAVWSRPCFFVSATWRAEFE